MLKVSYKPELASGLFPMESHGDCNKCKSPVFMNETIDCFGNTVLSLNCWNGHYMWLDVQQLAEDFKVDAEANVVKYIGFFDLA